jgi:deoxycytidylate deaminase
MNCRQNIIATIYDRKGRILSVGKNSYQKSHPKQAYFANKVGRPQKIFLHAELAAIIRCKGEPYKIKVERFGKNGNTMLAKPCVICQLAIQEAGIKVIEYTL